MYINQAWPRSTAHTCITHWARLAVCVILINSLFARGSGYDFNSLRPRWNGRHFPDGIFKCIFLNETVWISPKITLKFVPNVQINHIPALVQKMAWRRPGDKPLSEPMLVRLLTHMCVTRPRCVKTYWSMGDLDTISKMQLSVLVYCLLSRL